MTPDQIAQAAYDAMCRPTPATELAGKLLVAETRIERAALLDTADATMRDKALQYLARPEATRERERRLSWMRADPRRVAALKLYYRSHIAAFICEYGTTYDPRLIAEGREPLIPFELFERQRELVEWIVQRIKSKEHGLVAKGRDVGATATCVSALVSMCLLEDRFAAGVGSSKEEKIDRSGVPDTIFAHADNFLAGVPEEFKGNPTRLYMRLNFPNGSSFVGEAGNECGRGGRKVAYLMDEYAFHPFPQSVDAALSQNTNTVLWVSTFNGPAGPFYEKSTNDAIPRFDITWRHRPDRDEAWYQTMKERMDPVVFAQEVDANPLASREGAVIPALWIQSAVGLAEKLGLAPSGARYAALDIGDTNDRSAFAVRHGVNVEHVESWSGAGSDLARTCARAFRICDDMELTELVFDEDGLGAAMRGDARMLNESRQSKIIVTGYRGSPPPLFPNRIVPRSNRKWVDLCQNRKAQAWWALRLRFEQAHRAANGEPYDPDEIISLSPKIKELTKLCAELAQPTMTENTAGKLVIDKLGQGERSPNLADAVCMLMAPRHLPLKIQDDAIVLASASTYPLWQSV